MGDCSFGIEVEIKAECGAVTTKNFQYAEAQIEEGAVFTSFEHVRFNETLSACLRYYEEVGIYDFQMHVWSGGSYSYANAHYKCPKRATATVTVSNSSVTLYGAWGNTACTCSASVQNNGLRIETNVTGATAHGSALMVGSPVVIMAAEL